MTVSPLTSFLQELSDFEVDSGEEFSDDDLPSLSLSPFRESSSEKSPDKVLNALGNKVFKMVEMDSEEFLSRWPVGSYLVRKMARRLFLSYRGDDFSFRHVIISSQIKKVSLIEEAIFHIKEYALSHKDLNQLITQYFLSQFPKKKWKEAKLEDIRIFETYLITQVREEHIPIKKPKGDCLIFKDQRLCLHLSNFLYLQELISFERVCRVTRDASRLSLKWYEFARRSFPFYEGALKGKYLLNFYYRLEHNLIEGICEQIELCKEIPGSMAFSKKQFCLVHKNRIDVFNTQNGELIASIPASIQDPSNVSCAINENSILLSLGRELYLINKNSFTNEFEIAYKGHFSSNIVGVDINENLGIISLATGGRIFRINLHDGYQTSSINGKVLIDLIQPIQYRDCSKRVLSSERVYLIETSDENSIVILKPKRNPFRDSEIRLDQISSIKSKLIKTRLKVRHLFINYNEPDNPFIAFRKDFYRSATAKTKRKLLFTTVERLTKEEEPLLYFKSSTELMMHGNHLLYKTSNTFGVINLLNRFTNRRIKLSLDKVLYYDGFRLIGQTNNSLALFNFDVKDSAEKATERKEK